MSAATNHPLRGMWLAIHRMAQRVSLMAWRAAGSVPEQVKPDSLYWRARAQRELAEAHFAEARLEAFKRKVLTPQDIHHISEVQALRARAHTGIACAVFTPGWRREEQHAHWQGYAAALRHLSRGMGRKAAEKDAASTAYQQPAVLKRAIGLLGDDIEHLTRAEILKRLHQADVALPFDDMADLNVTAWRFEDGPIAAVDSHDEQITDPVNHSALHGRSVAGAKGGAA